MAAAQQRKLRERQEVRGRAVIITMCNEVLLPKKWEVENKSFPLLPFVTFAFGLLNFFFCGKTPQVFPSYFLTPAILLRRKET